ncbi:Glutathione hydrolase proenzyme [Lachnellula hyalina]|uniref:Glutathione hydrolase n=1 Tax=Lachnellula hyalina TaxID=1316788 RepID=A0A8H8TWM0_9HELO|nr:Glutathione hydrolase proenzyme [Lachnellula hyalina]TVY22106.1 Glutathione hydrolase proenzyme [Lachnellula hyalina]
MVSPLLLLALSALASAYPKQICDGANGAVASESKVCSQIGIDVLKDGGNAADALVAQQFCVGVVGMYHSGVGGGGFMTVRSPKGEYEFIDFREMAPGAAFESMYSSNINLSLYGGLASGVPGELRGLEYLHKKYGSKPWKQLLQPAIKVARDGQAVTADLVRYIGSTANNSFLTTDPSWALDFAPNGTLVKLGDTLYRKRYAKTLQAIAEHGPNAFYYGPIANATINALQSTGGSMTLSDLANYTIKIRPHSNITYRGYKITTGSAPSSGAVVLSALKIVEGYDMSTPSLLNLSTHYLDEAMKFGYGQRTELGDPTFVTNITAYQQRMYSEKTAGEVRSLIQANSVLSTQAYNPSSYDILTDDGTSAAVAADKSGLTIAITSTINTLFGSRVMVPETGIIMNNEMNDFSVPGTTNAFGFTASPANYIRPFKRPLSSISPSIVEYPDGSVYISHASAGGSRIITEIQQHLWHVLDQNMTSAQALAQPRMHDQLAGVVSFEYGNQDVQGYNNETTAFFAQIGANVTFVAPGQTTAQALRRLANGTFEAASEPRQENSGAFVI